VPLVPRQEEGDRDERHDREGPREAVAVPAVTDRQKPGDHQRADQQRVAGGVAGADHGVLGALLGHEQPQRAVLQMRREEAG
jgi:hypothetical protein